MKKYSIEDMQQLAEIKEGRCLSTKYINKNTKLKWKCKKGHIWNAPPNSILYSNVWCPICGRENSIANRRLGIEKVKEIGRQRGFDLLSQKYINSEQKLDWICSEGHSFSANITTIKNGKYPCPTCRKKYIVAHNKKGIEFYQQYAEKYGGTLIKLQNNGKLLFRCADGHEWEMTKNSVYSGCWCVKCSYLERGKRKRNDIDVYKQIAKKRGGKLLSDEYLRTNKKLLWECKQGHRWKANAGSIAAGSWYAAPKKLDST